MSQICDADFTHTAVGTDVCNMLFQYLVDDIIANHALEWEVCCISTKMHKTFPPFRLYS